MCCGFLPDMDGRPPLDGDRSGIPYFRRVAAAMMFVPGPCRVYIGPGVYVYSVPGMCQVYFWSTSDLSHDLRCCSSMHLRALQCGAAGGTCNTARWCTLPPYSFTFAVHSLHICSISALCRLCFGINVSIWRLNN